MDSNPKWEHILRTPIPMDSWDERVVALEKLLCDLIVTQGRREKVLLSQLANLQAELNRRSVAFQHTLMHYEKRLQQLNSKKQGKTETVPADSDSGVGEEQLTLQLAAVLYRHKGSLGFSVAGRNSPRKDCKDLVVSHINPTGPAKGKLLLHDKIVKVNGVEISNLGHDEAVAVFKAAQEPIVLEVLRQLPMPWIRLSEASTQTENISENMRDHVIQSFVVQDTTTIEERTREHRDEVLNEYDIEYEEVVLPKTDADAKLGLTLFCAPESESDVFISDVDPQSVAGRDGRIRSGDQVVQVNGVDIQTTDQAAELFGAEKSIVSVVVARPLLKTVAEEDSKVTTEERADDFASPLITHFPTLLSLDRVHTQSILEEDEDDDVDEEEEDDDSNSKPAGLKSEATGGYEEGVEEVEKDSGVERTDDSLRNEESSEQESLRDSGKLASSTLSRSGGETQQSDLVGGLSTQRHCAGSGTGRHSASRSPKLTEVASGRRQVAVDKSDAVEMWVESTACKGSLLRHLDEELCLSMFLPPPPSEAESDTVSVYSCECCKCHCSSSTGNVNQSVESSSLSPSTLYTNHNNLARTIKLQQQLFRRALLSSSSTARQVQPVDGQTVPHSSTPLEWKMKRRSDGSRYIVRRPVRNRLLKERASRLAEERGGITTDDDTMSELKVGRYWSKEERKKHMERSRERHRRKEEHSRLRTDGGTSGVVRNQESSSGQTADILELSRRKMMRIKGKTLFDDFTTVQEVLVHGSRGKGASRAPHKLLSVTTV